MRDKKLYAPVLGIRSPWKVADVELPVGMGEVKFLLCRRLERCPRWPRKAVPKSCILQLLNADIGPDPNNNPDLRGRPGALRQRPDPPRCRRDRSPAPAAAEGIGDLGTANSVFRGGRR